MSTLTSLYLLLAASSALVSSQTTSSVTSSAVFNNCSGDYPYPLPGHTTFTPDFKPQISTNGSGAGWEEWLVFAEGYLEDGSNIDYGYRWSMGDPASANLSNVTFSAWVSLPNGTFYDRRVHDAFGCEDNEDGGFACSIANNSFTWDPVHGSWQISVNADGLVTSTHIEVVEPGLPFAPNYNSTTGQLCDGFFTRMDVPRGHMTGYLTLPNGLNLTTARGIGSLKHTWGHKSMADTLSAYIRGTLILSNIVATVNWYQAWDLTGKEIASIQFLEPGDSSGTQAFRIQITDVPDILDIVTTPEPTSLPLTYNGTELTFPMCGPGADFDDPDRKMRWNVTNLYNMFEFTDSAGGVTLYQKVNITGIVWVNSTSQEFTGDGIVELYHRG